MTLAEHCLRIGTELACEKFAVRLDRKIEAVLGEVERSEVYRLIADPATDPCLVMAIVKHLLLEIFSCGPHVTAATRTAIAHLPKGRPDREATVALLKRRVLHDLCNEEQSALALRDFIALGGDEAWARSRRITPESFAMAATCRMLGERENSFCYLGSMVLFERLTCVLAARAQEFLKTASFPSHARRFIDTHANAEIDLLRDLVIRVVREYPESAAAIEYGVDCIVAVYPLPIWKAALQNARAERR